MLPCREADARPPGGSVAARDLSEATLPGYSAIFKHANEELNFCYYLIPGGPGEGQCGNVFVRPKPSASGSLEPSSLCPAARA